MSSINNPPIREKFYLMRTVWFVLQKPFTSLRMGIKLASWTMFCASLFRFDCEATRIEFGDEGWPLMCNPTEYKMNPRLYGKATRSIPEPILSQRLAHVAISCMQYLHCQDSNTCPTQNHLLTWAMKSKRSPWLWRQRMRVTSIGRRQPTWDYDGPKYSFPQSLRRSHQALYSKVIKSEGFYQEQHIYYTWTLDLLYHTLCKAMKSDELIKALSKSFIPSVAHILFPRRIRRVRKVADAYLEKVSPRPCLNLEYQVTYLYVYSLVHLD